MIMVVNKAVEKAYGGSRAIYWVELLAGDKAEEKTGERMSKETLEVLKEAIVAIKGPLGTPVGKGGEIFKRSPQAVYGFLLCHKTRLLAWTALSYTKPREGKCGSL
jgi:isocitrate/isopropylmalate dehydrogenase